MMKFQIQPDHYVDEATGAVTTFYHISATSNGADSGMLTCDTIDDLKELHRELSKHVTPDDKEEIPVSVSVVKGWLDSQYRPASDDPGESIVAMTSQEIAVEIADMADIELNDIAEAMIRLGYRAWYWNGKVGWMLARI